MCYIRAAANVALAQPRRVENARILVANTAMDTDKIKIYGSRVRVDSMAKVWLVHHMYYCQYTVALQHEA
jgi:hypothetical protein